MPNFSWTLHLLIASLGQHRGRVLVSIVAIALGVALGYAVQAINQAAVNEFTQALQTLSGEADLTVRGPRVGFDEQLYAKIARMPEVAVASPLVELDVRVEQQDEPLHVVGVDVFRALRVQPALVGDGAEPIDTLRADTVFVSPAAAQWLRLRTGDTLRVQIGLREVAFRVAGLLPASTVGRRMAVMDIAAAQWHFERPGKLTRIDLRMRPGSDRDTFQAALQRALPPGVFVESPQSAIASNLRMSRAYRVNLNVLALVALFTGGLLVLSTQALSVIRRRSELAFLRVLGVTRGRLLRLLAAESVLIGAVGALLGLLLGYALASALAAAVGGDLGAGFFAGISPQLRIEWSALLLYLTAGVLAALGGGLLPAIEAARAQPAPALKAGDEESSYARLQRPWPGVVLVVAGAAVVGLPAVSGLPLFGYIAIALLLLGTILIVPWLSREIFERVPIPRGVSAALAIAQLRTTSGQAGIGLAAIVAAVSLIAAMAIMVTSFRASLGDWLQRMAPADLYVRAQAPADTGFLNVRAQEIVSTAAGVERTEFLRSQQILLDPTRPRVTLLARDLALRGAADILPLVSGSIAPRAADPPPVWISEPIADLFKLRPGMRMDIPLAGRAVAFTVAGVWRDYARQNGALVIERALYVKLTGDRLVTDAALWLRSGTKVDAVRAALAASIAGAERLEMIEPGAIRDQSLSIFDRTFAVTYALEACAVVIGLFGLSSSVAGQVLARRREFAMLRHIGISRAQMDAMLAIEGLLACALGVGVGLALGWLLSLVLIEVVNRHSFHWSMELHLPWGYLALFAAAMLILATLLAAASGRRALGNDVARAVRDDW